MNEYHASFLKKNGYDNWTLPTGEIISLKSSEKRISFEEFEIIFELQLGKNQWDFDYLLGKYGVS